MAIFKCKRCSVGIFEPRRTVQRTFCSLSCSAKFKRENGIGGRPANSNCARCGGSKKDSYKSKRSYCRSCVSAMSNGSRWERKFNFTWEDYERLFSEQEGRCAICRKNPAKDVDHDHVSGKVRALLCNPCNKGLGCFRENPSFLREAARYVEAHAPQSAQSEKK